MINKIKKEIICLIFAICLTLSMLSGCGGSDNSTEDSSATLDSTSASQISQEIKEYILSAEVPTGYSALLDTDITVGVYCSTEGEVNVTIYAAYNFAIPYLAEIYLPISQEAVTVSEVVLSSFSVYFNTDEDGSSADWRTSNMESGIFFDETTDTTESGWTIDDIYDFYSDYEETVSSIVENAGGEAIVSKYEEKFAGLLDDYQGEWSPIDSSGYVIISQDTFNIIHEYNITFKEYISVNSRTIDIDEDNNIVVLSDSGKLLSTIYLNEEGQLVEIDASTDEETIYEYVSDNTEVPAEKDDPEIGMTEEEVLASSWGSPNKKNTTTTAYGEREQWVYDDGYIYFDDGIVTTIQE